MASNAEITPLGDGTSTDLTPETWPLEEILRRTIHFNLQQLRVCLPARVTRVHGDQTVDLQPLFQVTYVGQKPTDMPQVLAVPVLMPQGNTWRVSYPLAVGDTGLCLVADRNLDTWLAGRGESADPQDDRAHDLNDAIFLPGLVPTGLQTADTSGDVVLQNAQVTLRLNPKGQLSVTNSSQELVSVLHAATQCFIDTLQALQGVQALTAFGPAPLLASNIAQLAQMQSRASQILQNLDTFKS